MMNIVEIVNVLIIVIVTGAMLYMYKECTR